MEKISTLFKRAHDGEPEWRGPRPCIREIRPGCEWVLEGLGVATEKFDGTSCLLRDGKLLRRQCLKPTKVARKNHTQGDPWLDHEYKTPWPNGWWSCDDAAPNTGLWPGWIPINGDDPADKWHVEGFNWLLEQIQSDSKHTIGMSLKDGTFELVGPKVEKNAYDLVDHQLWRHGSTSIVEYIPPGTPRTYESIVQNLKGYVIEGVVFHLHDENGKVVKMAKIKRRDLGLKWPPVKKGPLTKLEEKLATVDA